MGEADRRIAAEQARFQRWAGETRTTGTWDWTWDWTWPYRIHDFWCQVGIVALLQGLEPLGARAILSRTYPAAPWENPDA